MEDHRTACNLLLKNDFLGKLELKEAYFLIPIATASRKYLRFWFKGTYYMSLRVYPSV